ncbi:O-antigen ligase family protein [Noviherbaspirillum cavernae]|nr:O-antigen ligase family protein [Noviherbaspirillum cavernae]
MRISGVAATRMAGWFFVLALFFVSTSTALTNVFVWLAYLSFPFALYADRELRDGLRLRPSLLALALFGLFILGTLWTIAPANEVRGGIGKYLKLLLIPLGMALAWRDDKLTKRAMIAFMAGAAILAVSSYLARLGLVPGSIGIKRVPDPHNAVVFKNHITTGVLLGFAAVACFAYYHYAATTRTRILSIVGGLFFAFPIIFLTQGRTGYIVLFVGLMVLSLARFHARPKMLVISIMTVLMLFAGTYFMSNNVKSRVQRLVSEMENHSGSPAGSEVFSSSGIRLAFYRGGLRLIAENPLLGSGTGSFQEAFSPIAKTVWPVGSEMQSRRHQPHSEIILIGVQLGAAGLVLYALLMASLAFGGRKNASYAADCVLILCGVFFISAMFNSLLWDVTEGHWFALLAGCLYAQARRGVPMRWGGGAAVADRVG